MRHYLKNLGSTGSLFVLGGLLTVGGVAGAQSKTVPDAQVEANVLKALASAPQLANQSITTTTVYGTVTLSGNVTDEASRTLAETLTSRAPGVQKVVDELTLGAGPAVGADNAQSNGAGADNSGADGAVPPPPPATSPDWGPAGPPPDVANGTATGGGQPQLQSDGTMAPPAQQQQQYPAPQGNGGAYPQQGPQPYPQQGPQPYPQQGPQPYPQQGGQPYPQQAPYPQQQPYNGAPPAGYAQGQPARPPYGAQVAGTAVTIPNGALVRVRINEGLDSKHTKQGAIFDAMVLNDVVADNEVAIPRGASVQGTVVESKNSGAIGGKGDITLALTQVTLGGRVFPIVSDQWSVNGRDKTGQTVGNAVGLGIFGALVGAVAGGGPGAAIGAAAGGAAGIGTSAATGSARVVVPPEAILTFHLAQPAAVTTVSQAEMDRLGAGAQAQLQRRYPPQPPPPGYYAPRPYPYPY